ncbi:hypothetical protein ASJ83_03730 [Methanocorpusculum parvum]|jgi:myosin heavy subunit|uniref:Uncharacterized protein n=1 Tax=Methanocorpusculum parvum TaxID=2193 RepID=A0AAX0Q5D1_9EURY|nr:hypothetical protein ASJ83_03730 [Methanocorpusculum parvum]
MIPSSSLSEFFAGLRSIGLFTRLFSWKKVIRRGDDAYARYQAEENEAGRRYREIEIRLDQLSGELQRERGKNASLEALRDAERKSSQDTRDRFEVTARELEITRGKLFGLERARDEQSLAETERRQEERARYLSLESAYAELAEQLSLAKGKIAAVEGAREEQALAETERRQEEMARYRSLESAYAELAEQFSLAKGKIAALESLRDEQLSAEASRRKEEAQKYQELKENLDEVTRDLIAAKEQLSGHESVREEQAAEYNRKIERINTLYDQLKSDRETLANEQMNLLVKKQEELAVSWQKHETEVAESIRTICRKHDFVWCEKCEYPHQGTPDNVVLIGKMYTIFDAKSPKNPEELENFPTYLKNQAEAMKKYCKHDDVRKEVFLVVPSSTLDVLTTYQYDLAEYVVYVITPESLIPILQTLRQIENYEFTDTMSPEDQDKLCRFIGKLSHATKRKIQIDTYFSRELIDALRGIDMIPQDFAAEIGKYEQKAKLNPPMEKRVKMIEIEDVENEVRRMETEIAVRTAVGE